MPISIPASPRQPVHWAAKLLSVRPWLSIVGIMVEALSICLFLLYLAPQIEEVVVAEHWQGTESFRFIYTLRLGLGCVSLLMVFAGIRVLFKWKNPSAAPILGGLFLFQLIGLAWFFYTMVSNIFATVDILY